MAGLDRDGGDSRRTRRSLAKAAGVAFGALFSLAIKPKPAAAIQPPVDCFLRGTRILTARGYRKVEDLAIGDFVPTAFSGARPIEWIGRKTFTRRETGGAWPRKVGPVRISRSAIDVNVPSRDLYLSPEHAVLIDGMLIPVRDLVNGTTITRGDADHLETLEYFHIKLESHDVVEAEGASCETLLFVGRANEMFADYVRVHGTPAVSAPCAPRAGFNGGRSVTASRLRSAASPWIDRRRPLDIVRDRLEERGLALVG